ncbi:hypothetical protein [Nesterenkonia rhizosphaerae]|uniref:Uncharacterized protein n=1 Tax=Nesterenkonia rhizosphaerae TaxID=1348272 RepID=A0ABP9FWG1_9MICC
MTMTPEKFRSLCQVAGISRADLADRFPEVNPDNLRKWWTRTSPPTAAVDWVREQITVEKAVEARNATKAEYERQQDILALTVADAVESGASWASLGLRGPEVQRLLVRAKKLDEQG